MSALKDILSSPFVERLKEIFKANTRQALILNLAVMLLLFFLFILFFFYLYLPSTTNHDNTLTVPSLEGMSVKDVEEFLEKRDLRFEVMDTMYDEKKKPLTVVKQNPRANSTVKVNRKIYLTINAGSPPKVLVPDVIQGSKRSAELKITSSRLKLGKIEYVPSPERNAVIRISVNGRDVSKEELVRGYSVPQGTTVDLYVGDGGITVSSLSVPNLVGRPLEDAEFYLEGIGLKVGVITRVKASMGMGAGKITRQEPEPGGEVTIKPGETINLWVTDYYETSESDQ
ncbi:MAG: PASTA domain-containing protein [Cytophagales bacterium]|nr:MAG: PASTA domain-containing protein [Cytophagales bacterium]TAF60755.1 MAG: PASTA domain-containing protein [Cytophagales bacterium]